MIGLVYNGSERFLSNTNSLIHGDQFQRLGVLDVNCHDHHEFSKRSVNSKVNLGKSKQNSSVIYSGSNTSIFNSEKRLCKKCNEISYLGEEIPKISDNFKQVFSAETAYQMTSILEGVVQRGTGRGLKNLNLDLAGKTGTTNDNTDAWFIGFTSKLVIGVYVGMDEPQSLGKYETGAKTAMPIFKNFVTKAIIKKEARPFKVADNITMMVVDKLTGQKANFTSKETIVEVFKKDKINIDLNQNIDINNRLKNNNILRFY